jgi:hypothetical protein
MACWTWAYPRVLIKKLLKKRALPSGWLRRIRGSRHHFKMSATVIEFPGVRESGSNPTHNAKSALFSDGNRAPLTDFEIAAIESVSSNFQVGAPKPSTSRQNANFSYSLR